MDISDDLIASDTLSAIDGSIIIANFYTFYRICPDFSDCWGPTRFNSSATCHLSSVCRFFQSILEGMVAGRCAGSLKINSACNISLRLKQLLLKAKQELA